MGSVVFAIMKLIHTLTLTIISTTSDKEVVPGGPPKFHVDPTPKQPVKVPLRPVQNSVSKKQGQCSKLIQYASAQKLFDHEQLDSRMKVSQSHEWTRTKVA